jgi:hypothetical protein
MQTLLANVLALRHSADSDRYRHAGAELIKAISIEPPVAHRVLRFLFTEGQTRDEQVHDESRHRNGRGFDINPKRKHDLARKQRLTAKELEEASKVAIHFIEQVPRHATDQQIRHIMLGDDAEDEPSNGSGRSLPSKKRVIKREMRGPKGFVTSMSDGDENYAWRCKKMPLDSEDEEEPRPSKRRTKWVAEDSDDEAEPPPSKRRAKRVAKDSDDEEEPAPSNRRAKQVSQHEDEEDSKSEQEADECEADAMGVTGPSVRVLSPLAMDVYEEALRSLGTDLEHPRVKAADVLREMALQDQITLFDVHLALCITLRRVTPQAGDSVMVLWPGMGCWYQGTVSALRPGAVKVHYMDGDIEWVVDRCQWMYVCNKA